MNRLRRIVSLLMLTIMFTGIMTACKEKEAIETLPESPTVTDTAEVTVEPTTEPEVTIEPVKGTYVKPEGNVTNEEIFKESFEGELTASPINTATITIDTNDAYEGQSSLNVSNRADATDGVLINISDQVEPGNTYFITAYVKYNEGSNTEKISLSSKQNDSAVKELCNYTATKGEWLRLKGTVYISSTTTDTTIMITAANNKVNFLIDNVVIAKQTVDVKVQDLPKLKDVYADFFSIGAVMGSTGIQNDRYRELVASQFNSFTLENEMKPDAILDRAASEAAPIDNERAKINFSRAEMGMQFALENGIKMRGHVLVWHSQTPDWFFRENFSTTGAYVTREVMLKRMENYIHDVLDYCQTNYPGLIYAWDVVNEAINPGDGHPDGLRTESNWYKVIGDDFIDKAFEYARKYADPDVKLFYNDYNTEETAKIIHMKKMLQRIYDQGNIDGVGLQSHIGVGSPSVNDIDTSIREYAEIGLEIQLTELDMAADDDSDESMMKQAKKYKMLFLYLMRLKNEGVNISNVTIWGTTDDRSWLNGNGQKYPLLFDKYFQAKPAFWGVLQDEEIKLF